MKEKFDTAKVKKLLNLKSAELLGKRGRVNEESVIIDLEQLKILLIL
jgi:uncharacterized protein YkvS